MNQGRELFVKENAHLQHRQISGKYYEGIIPSPEMMKEYKEIDVNLPIRIIKLTEEEFNHRRCLERKIVNNSILTNILGMLLGFGSILAIGYLAYLFMINGNPDQGKWVALSTATVVGIFVIRKFITAFRASKATPEQDNN
jgi:uncharacterized membrane protein